MAEPREIALQERAVEAVERAQALRLGLGHLGVGEDHDVDGVAGHEADEQEDHQRHDGEHQQRFGQTAHKVGKHSARSEEHTSELQSLMRISYAVFCLKKKK